MCVCVYEYMRAHVRECEVRLYRKECEIALGNAKERVINTGHGVVVGLCNRMVMLGEGD